MLTPRQQDQANVEALRALNLRNADRTRRWWVDEEGPVHDMAIRLRVAPLQLRFSSHRTMSCITTTRDIPAGSAIVHDPEANALTVIGPDRECIIHAKPFA